MGGSFARRPKGDAPVVTVRADLLPSYNPHAKVDEYYHRFIESEGRPIAYSLGGVERPKHRLLILNGTGSDMTKTALLANMFLGVGCRVLMTDYANFGAGPKLAEELALNPSHHTWNGNDKLMKHHHTVADSAIDVWLILQHEDWETHEHGFHIVAISMGGIVTMELLRYIPQNVVRSITFINSTTQVTSAVARRFLSQTHHHAPLTDGTYQTAEGHERYLDPHIATVAFNDAREHFKEQAPKYEAVPYSGLNPRHYLAVQPLKGKPLKVASKYATSAASHAFGAGAQQVLATTAHVFHGQAYRAKPLDPDTILIIRGSEDKVMRDESTAALVKATTTTKADNSPHKPLVVVIESGPHEMYRFPQTDDCLVKLTKLNMDSSNKRDLISANHRQLEEYRIRQLGDLKQETRSPVFHIHKDWDPSSSSIGKTHLR